MSHKLEMAGPFNRGDTIINKHFTLLYFRKNQNIFIANRYSSISFIKDKSIATCADVTRLLLMFEHLRLALAKKRCEYECNKTIISENFCVFPFVKTSGYHIKCLFSN